MRKSKFSMMKVTSGIEKNQKGVLGRRKNSEDVYAVFCQKLKRRYWLFLLLVLLSLTKKPPLAIKSKGPTRYGVGS